MAAWRGLQNASFQTKRSVSKSATVTFSSSVRPAQASVGRGGTGVGPGSPPRPDDVPPLAAGWPPLLLVPLLLVPPPEAEPAVAPPLAPGVAPDPALPPLSWEPGSATGRVSTPQLARRGRRA